MFSKFDDKHSPLCESLKKEGAIEIYDLGILQDKKIANTDKGVVYELYETLSCIIRDYLRLYNKVNLKANYPTAYLKALYPEKENVKDCIANGCTVEEINKWTDMVEEVAKKFDTLAQGYTPNQNDVNLAFDMLKEIFLGLWA